MPLRATPAAPEEEKEPRRNKVGLFLGGTVADDELDPSFGALYVRSLTDLVRVGVILEGTPATEERIVTVPGLFLHPWRGLVVTLAPGASIESGTAHFLFRTGLAWDFELPAGFFIAPEINYDAVVDEADALVFGFSFGYTF